MIVDSENIIENQPSINKQEIRFEINNTINKFVDNKKNE